MDDPIARKISDAKSILLVIPTDIDFSTIFAGIAYSQTIKNKAVTVLNDAITTNKLLVNKLKDYRFNALHTKATRSFTLIINKQANNIKQSFIDETEEKISVSLETAYANDVKTDQLIELKQPKLDQDLVVALVRNLQKGISIKKKYTQILDQLPPEKLIYLSCDDTPTTYTFWTDIMLKIIDPSLFDAASLTLLLASLIIECDLFASKMKPATFDLIQKLTAKGAVYNEAYNIATNLFNFDETSYLIKELSLVKNLGNGIYYSHIDDPAGIYSVKPPYIPVISKFTDCKVAFVIISRSDRHRVFVVNNKDQFDLSALRKEYRGVGDDTYFYFNSKLDINTLEQDITRKVVAITTGSVFRSQITSSPDIDQTTPANRFTQGLTPNVPDPLAAAPETFDTIMDSSATPSQIQSPISQKNGSSLTVAEEC